MVTHSSILAWKIPWTEEPGELHAMGSQRVRNDLVTEHMSTCKYTSHFFIHSSISGCRGFSMSQLL